MKQNIIGRDAEKAKLERLLASSEPELLAVYGRRRVGKTFLIREFFEGRGLRFELTGEKGAKLSEQLQNFSFAFQQAFPTHDVARPRSWREALQLLAQAIDREKPRGKTVIFLDELPWLASRRSGFLQALDHFWNSWANRRQDLILVVCGSAASWMIGKLIHDRGGLYNRVTAQIRLMPFVPAEMEEYLRHRHVSLSRKDLLELYMCLGGVPYYLRQVEGNMSVAQNIDRLCFARNGVLRNEFDRMFQSLFENADSHATIIRALAKKRLGLTRPELSKAARFATGGNLSRILEELEQSGFISITPSYAKAKNGAIYRLTDEFSLFHLTWVEKMKAESEGHWLGVRAARSWQSWAGFSFEGICLKNVQLLKNSLGIGAVHTTQSGWTGSVDDVRAQIDLVLDRADNCINLFEMKFSDREFVVSKQYAAALRRKQQVFREATGTRKNLFLTIMTTHGCRQNANLSELSAITLTMDTLFSGQ